MLTILFGKLLLANTVNACRECTGDSQESRQHGEPSVGAIPSVSLGPSIKMHIKNVRLIKYITDPQYSHETVLAKIHAHILKS